MGCRKLGLLEAPVWEEAWGTEPDPRGVSRRRVSPRLLCFLGLQIQIINQTGQGAYECPGAFSKLTLTKARLSTQRSHRQADWLVGQNDCI